MFTLESIDESLALSWNGQTVLNYHFAKGEPRTYWHPLQLPGSPPLTMNRPSDHVHHQGMWVAWKKVNGVNFWEQPKPGGDPTGFGNVVHQRIVDQSTDADRACFASENAWIDWAGKTHLMEFRQTTVLAPESDHLIIDLELTFKPQGQEVVMDLMRGQPGGEGLFYSGLTIRFDNVMTPGQTLDADQRTEEMDIFGKQSRWCGFAGQHPADGQVYGATIIDHPENPRHPTTWWVRNQPNYALLQPSSTYYEPFHIARDEQLQFRYRVALHRGRVDQDLNEQLASGFA